LQISPNRPAACGGKAGFLFEIFEI